VTPNDFRRIALSMPDVVEASHAGHPDFRVGGKIFATLGYPDARWAMGQARAIARSERDRRRSSA
jgi:hypothetical protein